MSHKALPKSVLLLILEVFGSKKGTKVARKSLQSTTLDEFRFISSRIDDFIDEVFFFQEQDRADS